MWLLLFAVIVFLQAINGVKFTRYNLKSKSSLTRYLYFISFQQINNWTDWWSTCFRSYFRMDSIDVYLEKKRKRREFFNQSAKRAKVKYVFVKGRGDYNNNNYYMPSINFIHQIMINYFVYNEVKQSLTKYTTMQPMGQWFDILAHAGNSTCFGL